MWGPLASALLLACLEEPAPLQAETQLEFLIDYQKEGRTHLLGPGFPIWLYGALSGDWWRITWEGTWDWSRAKWPSPENSLRNQDWVCVGFLILHVSWEVLGISPVTGRIIFMPKYHREKNIISSHLWKGVWTYSGGGESLESLKPEKRVCIQSNASYLGFPGGASGKDPTCRFRRCKRRRGFYPWVGKIPWRGYGNPLQYSCLENPMDKGTCQATVPGVARVRDDLVTKPPPLPGIYNNSKTLINVRSEMEYKLTWVTKWYAWHWTKIDSTSIHCTVELKWKEVGEEAVSSWF